MTDPMSPERLDMLIVILESSNFDVTGEFVNALRELKRLRAKEPPHCPTCECEPGSWGAKWQPIETAPKDGTRILLGYFPEPAYEGALVGKSQEVAFWHGTKRMWCGRTLLNAEGYFSPTHWMPLPMPPSSAAAKPTTPGDYTSTCIDCNRTMEGADKRCILCVDCADKPLT